MLSVLFCCFNFASVCEVDAQPSVTSINPLAVQIGKQTKVKLKGKFSNWPVEIWQDRDDVEITVGEESATLTIKTESTVAPETVWLRLYDPAGASELFQIPLEQSPVVIEAEPNERLREASVLDLPCSFTGLLSKSGDVDVFGFQLAENETIVACLRANRLFGSPMDAVMQITDSEGNVLLQVDDERGIDPLLTLKAKSSGNYFVRLFAFPEKPNSTISFAGGADFAYLLQLTKAGFLDHCFPLAVIPKDQQVSSNALRPFGWNLTDAPLKSKTFPNRSRVVVYSDNMIGTKSLPLIKGVSKSFIEDEATQEPVELPFLVSGRISQPGETDVYRFKGKKGTKYQFEITSRRFDLKLDGKLRILDSNEKELASKDDISRTEFDPLVEFKVPDDGEYKVEVSDVNGESGLRNAYLLKAQTVSPSFQLKLVSSQFQLKSSGEIEIEVEVTRSGGHAKPIEVTVTGLPDGVTTEKVVSEPKGPTSTKVKLKLRAEKAKPSNGSFEIIGMSQGIEQHAIYSIPNGYDLQDVWLTVADTEEKK